MGVRGVRVVTPTSKVFDWDPLARLFTWAEHAAKDAPLLRHLGGFLIVIARKRDQKPDKRAPSGARP